MTNFYVISYMMYQLVNVTLRFNGILLLKPYAHVLNIQKFYSQFRSSAF